MSQQQNLAKYTFRINQIFKDIGNFLDCNFSPQNLCHLTIRFENTCFCDSFLVGAGQGANRVPSGANDTVCAIANSFEIRVSGIDVEIALISNLHACKRSRLNTEESTQKHDFQISEACGFCNSCRFISVCKKIYSISTLSA